MPAFVNTEGGILVVLRTNSHSKSASIYSRFRCTYIFDTPQRHHRQHRSDLKFREIVVKLFVTFAHAFHLSLYGLQRRSISDAAARDRTAFKQVNVVTGKSDRTTYLHMASQRSDRGGSEHGSAYPSSGCCLPNNIDPRLAGREYTCGM